MKKLLTYLVIILFTCNVKAQAPQKMNYQAVIRNSSNALVTNHLIGMRITILQGSTSGTPVYIETQAPVTNLNGLVSIEIGGGVQVTGTFAAIDWSAGTYFIKTETDPAGGTNYTISGTSQLLSVPYALYAKTSGYSLSGNYNDLTNKPDLDALLKEINYLKEISGIGSVTDIDGNVYKTIKIGTQVWMAENLKTTRYYDGTPIPLVNSVTSWAALPSTGKAYCWYADNIANKNIYGALYTWSAAMNGANGNNTTPSGVTGACPIGWYVPSQADWNILINYCGGYQYAVIKLREAGTSHWTFEVPTTRTVTNESGFTALPGGYRHLNGTFFYMNYSAYWWTSLHFVGNISWGKLIDQGAYIVDYDLGYTNGVSVRCVKGN